jgi:hypothetical protein
VTMQAIRCSAWFGSVRFGFLAPEIFIRIGSGRRFQLLKNTIHERNEDNKIAPIETIPRAIIPD